MDTPLTGKLVKNDKENGGLLLEEEYWIGEGKREKRPMAVNWSHVRFVKEYKK